MKRILIVDDEQVLRMLIADTLEELDAHIEVAADGRAALEKLDESEFDLLILDYMMPELTGMEVLEQLTSEQKERMFILMLTAKAQESDRVKALSAGVTAFVPKPFSPLVLLQIVEDMLG